MGINRSIVALVIALALALAFATTAAAAELPSHKRAKPQEAMKHCNIAGSPGVLAANGVCVRLSGYISAGVTAGQIK